MPRPNDETTALEVQANKIWIASHDTVEWLDYNKIVNEKGEPISFEKHMYLLDIFNDQSPNIVCKKAAQIGFSTLAILKNIRDAQLRKMDIIYTLPTDNDVQVFVGGKVNRIIQNNPPLAALTEDNNSIEKKQVGQSMLYFRGTWTKKAAIMITADRLVHDEKDSSKQDVIADYQARLQHSKYKEVYVFSHPSVPNNGVDVEWNLSDQKEWFINCPHCQHQQCLTWDTKDPKRMSIDLETCEFVCKRCRGVLAWQDRADGIWRARKGKSGAKWSGYHISLLMAPYITALEIVEKYDEVMKGKQTMDFFYNKILGEPYAGSGNSVTEDMVLGAVTKEKNTDTGRIVIGVDTGVALRWVMGTKQGLIGFGEMKQYEPDATLGIELEDTLEYFLKKFPTSVMVIDQGGDIIGSRKLRMKYPGRVFLCHYARDRKTMQWIRWGEKEENGNVLVDRNRAMQMVIDELKEKRWKLFGGTRSDWYEYWLHWSHIYRTVEEDELGIPRYTWHRSDRDDWVHATVYWRVGIDRYGDGGMIFRPGGEASPNSYMVNPDGTASFDPAELLAGAKKDDPDPWWARNAQEDDEWR